MSTQDHLQLDKRSAAITPASNALQKGLEKEDNEREVNEKEGDNGLASLEEIVNNPSDYPKGPKLVMLLLGIYLSIFLVALDRTIIATALPQITDHFKSTADTGWYNAAFLLPATALQLFFGRLYTFYSPKWIFLTLIFVFEIGSVICGVAPSSIALILGRAVAGLGAGGILNGAMILMMYTAPPSTRALYMGLMSGVIAFASVAGPLLGGVFTNKVTWRWCFYINLPVGAAVLVFLFFAIEDTPAALASLPVREKIARLDIYGTVIFVPSMLWRKEYATVPPRLAKQRTVAGAVLYSFSLGSALVMVVYYLSVWFQAIKGDSAIRSGYSTLPLILSLVVASIFSGVLVSKTGYYNPSLIAGAVLGPIGAGLLLLFKPTTGHSLWIGTQVLFGFGIGMGLQQTNLAVQTVLDMKDAPTGTSLVIFGQGLGGTISVAIGQNIVDNKLISGLSNFNAIISQAIIHGGATQLRSMFSEQQLSEVLVVYNNAIVTVFYAATAFASATILGAAAIEWRSVKSI